MKIGIAAAAVLLVAACSGTASPEQQPHPGETLNFSVLCADGSDVVGAQVKAGDADKEARRTQPREAQVKNAGFFAVELPSPQTSFEVNVGCGAKDKDSDSTESSNWLTTNRSEAKAWGDNADLVCEPPAVTGDRGSCKQGDKKLKIVAVCDDGAQVDQVFVQPEVNQAGSAEKSADAANTYVFSLFSTAVPYTAKVICVKGGESWDAEVPRSAGQSSWVCSRPADASLPGACKQPSS
ncbi:MAG TPA: hypothetical protein VFO38_02050 [Candidatus Saccharimonadales bacterium]|nr:hypothetical protein [Candidatus Saccharimonadales bacterium]